MVAFTKALNFMSATVYEKNRGNQHSNKEKYPDKYLRQYAISIHVIIGS